LCHCRHVGFRTFSVDRGGLISSWSESAEQFFGVTAQSLLGLPLARLASVGLTEAAVTNLADTHSKAGWTQFHEVFDDLGRPRRVQTTASSFRDSAGVEEVIVVCVATDFAPHDRLVDLALLRRDTLSEHGADLSLLSRDRIAIGLVQADLSRLLGRPALSQLGVDVCRYFHPDDLPRFLSNWEALLIEPGSHRRIRVRIQNCIGDWQWSELRLTNALADPNIGAVVVNALEVRGIDLDADRPVDDLALTQHATGMATMMETSADGLWVVDPAGVTLHANHRMADLLGVSSAFLQKATTWDLLDQAANQSVHAPVAARAPQTGRSFELRLRNAAGVPRPFCVSVRPFGSDNGTGRVLRFTCVVPPDAAASHRSTSLSRQERKVVDLLLTGDRVPAIAQALFITQSTVRNHLSSSFLKLGVPSQQELIRLLR
jgi:PAS domain S-box-containing protein